MAISLHQKSTKSTEKPTGKIPKVLNVVAWMLHDQKFSGKMIAGLKDAGLLAARKAERDPAGKIHESLEKFWIFRGKRARALPSNAHIHQSVFDRMGSHPKYRPKIPRRHKKVQ